MIVFWHNENFCQEIESNWEELLLEQIGEELGENVDVSEVIERLQYILKHPLDINKATEEQLSELFFLSPQQISQIIRHREESGDFLSLLELQSISGLDIQTINWLIPFIRLGNTSSFKNLSLNTVRKEDEQMIMIRYGRTLENQQGYQIKDDNRSKYLGDPNAYSLRYRWNYQQRIKIGLNAEKDAGEPFFEKKQKLGFDFYSGYIEVNDLNKSIKKIVLGDFAMQVGQGLVLWNGLNFGKGAWVGTAAKQGVGLRSYSSMNEQNFNRGLAVKLEFSRWSWTPFVAYNRLSGNVELTDSMKWINTINISGLHRTPTEQSYRDAIGQLVIGSDIVYDHKRLKIGLTPLFTHFDGNIVMAEALRNRFDFVGNNLFQLGVHYKYNYRNMYLFGETAHSIGAGFATVNGIIASLHPKLSAFVNYRNFQRNYHNFFAQTLSESSNVSNEKGLYSGLVYHVTRKFEWVNYIDMFKFAWLRFRVDGPSQGTDFLSQFTYSWYKKGKILLRYRYRIKQENFALANANENTLTDVLRNQVRLEFQYKLSDTWNIKSRGELTFYEKKLDNRSDGFMIFQDVYWKGYRNKLQMNTRFAYFQTQDYDSRIYAYESDVLYASSFPMYYDKGVRTYVNVRYRLLKQMDVWLRYALTNYFGRETIGSGLDLIEGNKRSDIRFQIRWQW